MRPKEIVATLIGEAVSRLEPLMVEADERRRLGTRRPYRAAETDLKASLRTLIPSPAAEFGLELSGVEWAISPEDWPRVGPVDLVLAESGAAAARGRAAAFVELKWAIDDASGTWPGIF